MAMAEKVKAAEIFIGKLAYNADLLSEITDFCVKKDISLGRVEALGAVQRACLGFYDQQKKKYEYKTINEPMEIAKLIGNVSTKDNTPFVHAHITLTDKKGRAYVGHLAQGTVVFACEFILEAFHGPELKRTHDKETGLPLWEMED